VAHGTPSHDECAGRVVQETGRAGGGGGGRAGGGERDTGERRDGSDEQVREGTAAGPTGASGGCGDSHPESPTNRRARAGAAAGYYRHILRKSRRSIRRYSG